MSSSETRSFDWIRAKEEDIELVEVQDVEVIVDKPAEVLNPSKTAEKPIDFVRIRKEPIDVAA